MLSLRCGRERHGYQRGQSRLERNLRIADTVPLALALHSCYPSILTSLQARLPEVDLILVILPRTLKTRGHKDGLQSEPMAEMLRVDACARCLKIRPVGYCARCQ